MIAQDFRIHIRPVYLYVVCTLLLMEYLFISTTLTMTLLLFYSFFYLFGCHVRAMISSFLKKKNRFRKKKVSAPVPIPKLDPGFDRTLVFKTLEFRCQGGSCNPTASNITTKSLVKE